MFSQNFIITLLDTQTKQKQNKNKAKKKKLAKRRVFYVDVTKTLNAISVCLFHEVTKTLQYFIDFNKIDKAPQYYI